jgi:hypothetical protein
MKLEVTNMFVPERDELLAEIERLKTDPYKAGYIDGHHDAHAKRDEAYRDCPRCSW